MTARTRAILSEQFAPVSRLPPQVLGLTPLSLRSKRDLVNATAVCRYRHNTLLSSSGSRSPLREHIFRGFLDN